jgi:hypothetical protein
MDGRPWAADFVAGHSEASICASKHDHNQQVSVRQDKQQGSKYHENDEFELQRVTTKSATHVLVFDVAPRQGGNAPFLFFAVRQRFEFSFYPRWLRERLQASAKPQTTVKTHEEKRQLQNEPLPQMTSRCLTPNSLVAVWI